MLHEAYEQGCEVALNELAEQFGEEVVGELVKIARAKGEGGKGKPGFMSKQYAKAKEGVKKSWHGEYKGGVGGLKHALGKSKKLWIPAAAGLAAGSAGAGYLAGKRD